MDVSPSNQNHMDAVSPKITDYFTNSGPITRASSRNAKAKQAKMPENSVYLTPESSPGTEFKQDSVKESDDTTVMKKEDAAHTADHESTDTENQNNFNECEKPSGDTMPEKDHSSRENIDLYDLNKASMSSNSSVQDSSVFLQTNSVSCGNNDVNKKDSIPHGSFDPSSASDIQSSNSSSSIADLMPSDNSPRKSLESVSLSKTAESQGVISTSDPAQIPTANFKSPAGAASHIITTGSSDVVVTTSPSLPRSKLRKGAQSSTKTVILPGDAESVRPKPGRRKKKAPEPVQKNTITDFFPVRRSGRQTKSEIENEKQHQLKQQILSRCEDGLKVCKFDNKGRGVVATKDFCKGDFVVEYAGDLIDIATAKEKEKTYGENPQIGCYMYYFRCGAKQYCVDATAESGRLGRLLNHSREGNCCTRALLVDDVPRLILVANRNISSGEELCYDYGDRSKAALEAHPWLKS